MKNLLEGAYDLHIHCGPDVVPRAVTGLEMARRAVNCGMGGFAIKFHYGCTCQQAELVNACVPQCHAIGSLVMNSATGGVNPMAVETAARLGARIVWCPTFDSAAQQEYYLEKLPQHVAMQKKMVERNIRVPSYRLIDEKGNLIEEMQEVLDIIQEYNLVLGTGHITHEETFALAKESCHRGLKKLIITHADWSFTHYSVEEQKELVQLGATIEHSYTSPALLNSVSWETVFREIREIGPENIILSTDLGQMGNIFPDVGFQDYARRILEAGFSMKELHQMIVVNPLKLVER